MPVMIDTFLKEWYINFQSYTGKEMIILTQVEVKKDESFESALRRFKKKIEQEGILREVRDRKHYEKPSERKRKKAKSTRK